MASTRLASQELSVGQSRECLELGLRSGAGDCAAIAIVDPIVGAGALLLHEAEAYVGAAGIVTLVAIRLIAFIPPQMSFQWDWRPIAVYGLIANVCYTFGWAVEVALRKLMGDRAPNIGPALFRQGLAFSVGLTLLPILTVSFFWVLRAGAWFFR